MRGERLRAFEPGFISRPAPEGEERVGVAGSAVAEAGLIPNRARVNDQAPCAEEQPAPHLVVTRGVPHGHEHAGGTVTPLHANTGSSGKRVARYGRPVGMALLDDCEAYERVDRATLDLFTMFGSEQVAAAAQQDVRVADEAVRRTEVTRPVGPHLRRPQPRVERAVVRPLVEQVLRTGSPERQPTLFSGPGVKLGGEQHVSGM